VVVEPITREQLEAEFVNDPLFDSIQRMNLLDELFDEETLSSLIDGLEYTTTDFERWFCSNDSDKRYLSSAGIMRAFIKEMGGYLQVRNVGRSIIMDYKGVIKLKMALLLRKYGMKPALIYETAGAKAYSPVVLQRGQGTQATSQITQKDPKTELYNQIMESLVTQLSAVGAISQVNGKFQVDLSVLIDKQIEQMKPSLLQSSYSESEKKLEQISAELSDLKNKTGQVEEFKQKYEDDLAVIKSIQDQVEECRIKAKKYYQDVIEAKTLQEKIELTNKLHGLLKEYPKQEHIVKMYADAADNEIIKMKLEEKELRTQNVKNECLRLYEIMTDSKSTSSEKESARNELMELQKSNPDLAFEIRSFIAAYNAEVRNKPKNKGLFGWFKRSD